MSTIKYGVVAMVLFAAALVPNAHAQTATMDSLLERIQSLMEQVEELQQQLADVRGEVREEIRAGLDEGMTDEDVKKIQEILATDRSIYPEGLVTGYFGPLTRNALTRFQQKFELKATGELDEDTRAYFEELLEERFGDRVPPGLLIAPGIQKKIELRLREGCDDNGSGRAFLCQKLKIKIDDDETEIEIEDEDDDENDEEEGRDDAAEAIDDAGDAISELEEAIDDADEDDDGYDEAVEALEDAEDLLEEAESAYDDEDYDEAADKADEAEEAAEEGLETLEEDDDEDEEDDD